MFVKKKQFQKHEKLRTNDEKLVYLRNEKLVCQRNQRKGERKIISHNVNDDS